MMRDAIGNPIDGLVGPGDADLTCDLNEGRWAAVKAHLWPGEYVVWAEGGNPPTLPPIRVFPAFFAAVLCGCSGFALMVLFGIYGLRKMDLGELLFFLCLAPAALGGMTVIGLAWSGLRHYRKQRRIARSFYALTDRRALVGVDSHAPEAEIIGAWAAESFDGTLCTENDPESGDVYFLRDGEVIEPDLGFVGIKHAERVAVLIEEILLSKKGASEPDL